MNKSQSYLFDIQHACNLIIHFTKEMNLQDFEKNIMCQDAVIRRIEIIGEASNSLDISFKEEHQEIPWQVIRGMRNRLVHAYNEIDIELVWQTIQEDIPFLRQKIEIILKNMK